MFFRNLKISVLLLCLNSFAFAEVFLVKDIRVEGLQKISIDAVLQNLIVKPNNEFDTEHSHKMIQDLFNTGFFKKIDIEKENNTLVVKVVEYPSIGELIVKGVQKNEKIKKILVANHIEEGRIFNKNNLSKVETELKYHYFSQKRYGVKVDIDVSDMSRNRVRIVLDIYEGDVAKLKEIKIIGNQSFTEKQILKELNHQPTNLLSWFTKSDQYSKEKLEADLEILRSFYLDRGYINFKNNSTQVSLTPDKKNVYITFNITEGEKFYINNVKVVDLPIDDKVRDAATKKLKVGEAFSRKIIIDAQHNLEEALGQFGYSLAKVKISYDITKNSNQVNLVYFVENLKKILVRKINISGNVLTQDEVIRREIAQMESSTINTVKVKRSKENIQRLGFASNVDIDTVNILGASDQVDLNYILAEQKFNSFSMDFGYNRRDRFIFKVGTDLKNVVGTGKDINVLFERTQVKQNYKISYYNPYYTLNGIGFGMNGAYEKTNLSKTTDIADYSTGNSLADIYWSLPLSGLERLTVKFGYEQTSLKIKGINLSKEADRFTALHGRSYSNFFTEIGWIHNSLDKYVFPTKGFSHGINAKVTSPWDSLNYYKTSYDAKFYQPLNKNRKYIFSLECNLGYGTGYNSTKNLPFFRNFYVGGADTVRGFAENSLGPKDSKNKVIGGNLLLVGSIAMIFPNPLAPDNEDLRTSLFLDTGQVYDTQISHNYRKGLRYSAGFALAWNSPFGAPLSISFAKPLNSKSGDKTQFWQFSFSSRF